MSPDRVPMSPEVHAKRHQELHKALGELLADYIEQTGKLPSKINVYELLDWSNSQCTRPTGKS